MSTSKIVLLSFAKSSASKVKNQIHQVIIGEIILTFKTNVIKKSLILLKICWGSYLATPFIGDISNVIPVRGPQTRFVYHLDFDYEARVSLFEYPGEGKFWIGTLA